MRQPRAPPQDGEERQRGRYESEAPPERPITDSPDDAVILECDMGDYRANLPDSTLAPMFGKPPSRLTK